MTTDLVVPFFLILYGLICYLYIWMCKQRHLTYYVIRLNVQVVF